MKLPGLIDIHVHMREPGAIHKEDWQSGTAAALSGGFTQVLAMPNTIPPVISKRSLSGTILIANGKAYCDFAQFIGATPGNALQLSPIAKQTAGLKLYLDQTYGPLRLDDMLVWMEQLKQWPKDWPVVAHAESRSMAAIILLAALFDRSIHIAHVSLREEIIIIKHAKERGLKVTCEVCPHHLFLSESDIPSLGEGCSEVRPHLAASTDQQAIWENIDVVDCIATDHAPHTLEEKECDNMPPGFPGLETALPLMLQAVHDGLLTMEQLIEKMYTNPKRIFRLPDQNDTWIDVDLNESWVVDPSIFYSRAGWSPFSGRQVKGRVRKVVLRGQQSFMNGQLLADPGFGRDLRNVTVHRSSLP